MFLFGHVPPELAVEFRAHPADVAGFLDASGDIDAKRGVVDRQGPADRFDAGELRHARVGHDAQRRQRGFRHPVENLAVVLVADRAHGDAARRHLEFHFGHRGHHVGELRPAERAMQHRDVVGVDHVLKMLQPVAGNDRGAAAADRGVVGLDEFAVVHLFQRFVARQHRLFLCRSHIGEDQSVALFERIPGLAHLVPELAALGFAGLFEAMAFGVELPAVIAAADAVFLDLAVIERGAAVAAAGVEQAGPAMAVAEQDQILAERAHLARHVAGVGRKADRVPVAPQQFPHRGAAADRGQFGPAGRKVSWHRRCRDRDPAG